MIRIDKPNGDILFISDGLAFTVTDFFVNAYGLLRLVGRLFDITGGTIQNDAYAEADAGLATVDDVARIAFANVGRTA